MVLHNYRNIKPREQRNIYFKVLAINTILNFISASMYSKAAKEKTPENMNLHQEKLLKAHSRRALSLVNEVRQTGCIHTDVLKQTIKVYNAAVKRIKLIESKALKVYDW